jgi:hypothetical protein
MDAADGLIEAAEATGNPWLLATALTAYGMTFGDTDPVGALNALGRATRIASASVSHPTGRTLDIGEQKRHHPRRSSRRISGHPGRISQQPRSHLEHGRIRAEGIQMI